MTAAPRRDGALHLRCLDTDVRVDFAGPGADALLEVARRAWSRCLTAPVSDPVTRRVQVDDPPPEAEQVDGPPSEAEQRAERASTKPRNPLSEAEQRAERASTKPRNPPSEAEQRAERASTKPRNPTPAPSLETPQPLSPTPHPDLTGSDPAMLLDRLSPLVTLAAIEAQAGTLLMLHAAAVADPTTGRAIALVGPSGAGKTTATSALARRWGYLTDETVGIREDGSIAIYPKPLSVKVDATPFKEQRSLDDLGAPGTPMKTHLHRIVLLARDDSPGPWLEDVSTVQALALLAPETSYLSRLDRPLHRLAELLGSTGLRRLHYREAEQLPPVIEQILEED